MLSLAPEFVLALAVLTTAIAPRSQLDSKPGGAPENSPSVIVGEVHADRALIQVRLAITPAEKDGGSESAPGFVALDISTQPADGPMVTRRLGPVPAEADRDGIVRFVVSDLSLASTVHWQVLHGVDADGLEAGLRGHFVTPPGRSLTAPVRVVVANCMNMYKFLRGTAQPEERSKGFPGLVAILDREPQTVVFAGDSVYYDHPRKSPATTRAAMRAKWHELFAQPRMRTLLGSTATFWLKDDHDCRFDDCDMTGDQLPSSTLGVAMFREQVPVVAASAADAPTWRRVRLSRDLEIWMTEGRDHRSPNKMEDGPDKTLWGAEQRAWLQRTLLSSDATFRVLVSPTPLVGPDDARKTDNHTNHGGFRHEGDAFHRWAMEHKLPDEGFFVVCGDRHWKYHAEHPSGVEEYSCGALVRANSRRGRAPGIQRARTRTGWFVSYGHRTNPVAGLLSSTWRVTRVAPDCP